MTKGGGFGVKVRARFSIALVLCAAACSANLPEPESQGAVLYKQHCNGCHRVYAPTSMTYEMWKVQVERMQGEMVRRGVEPLNDRELPVVLDYLKRHSG